MDYYVEPFVFKIHIIVHLIIENVNRVLKFLLIILYVIAGNFVYAENADWIYIFKGSENTLIEISEPCLSPQLTIINQPVHGSASVNQNQISYSPETQYVGEDSVQYKTTCEGSDETHWLHFKVSLFPDNVDVADCVGEPEPVLFSIKEIASTPAVVSPITNPLCGDIDGDGEIELLVMNLIPPYATNTILIYGFDVSRNELYLKYSIDVPANPQLTFSPLAIAKVDGNQHASIFYTSSAYGRLFKYDLVNGNYTMTWSVQYTTNGYYAIVSPTITDIMGNGRTQICIFDKIYDTKTGALLADGGYMPPIGRSPYGFGFFGHSHSLWSNPSSSFESLMIATDVDGDGVKEVVGGDCVYAVNLVNFDGLLGNSFELKIRADNSAHPEIGDGGTAIADIDNDGQPEIIVSGPLSNRYTSTEFGMLYVYNPRTGEILHTNNINDIPRNQRVYGPSRPFVGDVDGDGFSEICLTGSFVLNTYKYDVNEKKLNLVWSLPTTDFSASTTLTMFDFAQDGKARLVYRDGESLRIINASTSPPTIEATFEGIYSPTVNEFPIVADVNGDGAAEIVVTGTSNENWNTASGNWVGELRVYASAGKPWAPARKVWNQSAYNVLNVNEDLTIPSQQISPSTLFRGADGIFGTSDDIRPFNNFMQQQTLLNKDGEPLWLLPDYELQEGWNIVVNKDFSATISFCIENKGSVNDVPPLYISFYKNERNDADIVAVQSYDRIPTLDQPECYELTVPDFKNITATSFVLSVNDKSNEFIIQECGYDNNLLDKAAGEFPLAISDTVDVCACQSTDIRFTTNDIVPEGTTKNIIRQGIYGSLQLLEVDILRYTNNAPCPTEKLIDTLTYELVNGNFSSRANIIIRINPLPEVGIEGAENICEQATVTLFPITGGTWVSNNPDIASVSANGTVTALKAGVATFTFTDENTGCSATTEGLTIVPLSDGSMIDIDVADVCIGSQATVIASSTAVINPVFRWYETAESTEVLFTGPTFTTPVLTEDKTYYVSVSGDNYCEGISGMNGRKAVTITVKKIAVPILKSVSEKTEIAENNDYVKLAVSNASDYDSPDYEWYWNEILIQGAADATYVATVPGNYKVKVTDGVCTAESTILVINDLFVIPNIITPYNKNGKNDTFLTPKDGKPGYKVEIYNRYQQRIFEGENGWDGTYRGAIATPGTYFYRIFMKDGKVLKGTLEVAKF
jgi:gliding motility-associated-like protein